MKRWQIYLSAVLLAAFSGISGYLLQQHLHKNNIEQNASPEEKQLSAEEVIGQQVQDFSLADMDGKQRRLSEWQGKVVVLNFWATWCPPCQEEIPAFVELQKRYASDGLQFIGIALQTADEVRDFVADYHINYPSLVGDNDVIAIAKALGNSIGALPYTVIIGRNGKIAFTRRGPLPKPEAESTIKSLL